MLKKQSGCKLKSDFFFTLNNFYFFIEENTVQFLKLIESQKQLWLINVLIIYTTPSF